MNTHPRRAALPLLVLLALLGIADRGASQAPAQDAPTTIVVVRHAEKVAGTDRDPALTEAGQRRARTLIDVVGNARVAAVYTTQFKRTRETGQPLADRLGVPVTVVEAGGGDGREKAAELATRILREHRGETVLVVGHSNTVPQIVEALSGTRVPAIEDREYDHLFVVVVPATGPARTIRARYGEAGSR
jgi:broad specificity phosphatase PhoE